MEQNNKRILIQKIEKLPTVSPVLSRIIAVADAENSSSAELTDVVSKDPAISSMILRLVNSAFYGHLREISSISRAVVILGFQTVKTMAMGVSLFQAPTSDATLAFDRKRFWVHSIAVAAFTKNLYQRSSKKDGLDEETAFLIGLLHDIGKVVFDSYLPNEHHQAIINAHEQRVSVVDMEKEIIGITHEEAGALLAHRWKFPPLVEAAIGGHHCANFVDDKIEPATALAHIGDHCAHVIGFDYSEGNYYEQYNPHALAICGLTNDAVSQAIDDIEKEREAIEGLLLD